LDTIRNQLSIEATRNELRLTPSDITMVDDLFHLTRYNDRDLYIIIITLLSLMNKGSSCLSLDSEYLIRTSSMLKVNDIDIKNLIKKIQDGMFSSLVSVDPNKYFPCYLINENEKNLLYFRKIFKSESQLKKILDSFFSLNEFKAIENIDKIRVILESKIDNNYYLNDNQKAAVILSLTKNFLIISGGPGSGKSTTISAIIKSLKLTGVKLSEIAVVAPTGKAANRLEEALKEQHVDVEGVMLSTIHRLLKYSPASNRFTYNYKNKLPIKVLIVDEVSMVDIVLMTSLLESLDLECTKILVGDKDQLPSIDIGSVLSDIIPEFINVSYSENLIGLLNSLNISKITSSTINSKFTDRIIYLDGNNRSNDSDIKLISNRVNRMDTNISESLNILNFQTNPFYCNKSISLIVPEDSYKKSIECLIDYYFDCYFIKSGYMDVVSETSQLCCHDILFNDKLYFLMKQINSSKILSVLKDSYSGVTYINSRMQEKIHSYNNKSFNGCPIIVKKNDYHKKVYNGDTGIILKDSSGIYFALFLCGTEIKKFPLSDFNNYDLSFCITIHKSQGSGFENILLIIPEKDNPILTKEIIYTAITRAKQQVFIFSNPELFDCGVGRKIERYSGLMF